MRRPHRRSAPMLDAVLLRLATHPSTRSSVSATAESVTSIVTCADAPKESATSCNADGERRPDKGHQIRRAQPVEAVAQDAAPNRVSVVVHAWGRYARQCAPVHTAAGDKARMRINPVRAERP